jgi:hypothetical protein
MKSPRWLSFDPKQGEIRDGRLMLNIRINMRHVSFLPVVWRVAWESVDVVPALLKPFVVLFLCGRFLRRVWQHADGT